MKREFYVQNWRQNGQWDGRVAGRLFDLLNAEYIRWIAAKWTDMSFILNFLKPVNLKFSLQLFGYSSQLRGAV
jgi:hypothetical protein